MKKLREIRALLGLLMFLTFIQGGFGGLFLYMGSQNDSLELELLTVGQMMGVGGLVQFSLLVVVFLLFLRIKNWK